MYDCSFSSIIICAMINHPTMFSPGIMYLSKSIAGQLVERS